MVGAGVASTVHTFPQNDLMASTPCFKPPVIVSGRLLIVFFTVSTAPKIPVGCGAHIGFGVITLPLNSHGVVSSFGGTTHVPTGVTGDTGATGGVTAETPLEGAMFSVGSFFTRGSTTVAIF